MGRLLKLLGNSRAVPQPDPPPPSAESLDFSGAGNSQYAYYLEDWIM